MYDVVVTESVGFRDMKEKEKGEKADKCSELISKTQTKDDDKDSKTNKNVTNESEESTPTHFGSFADRLTSWLHRPCDPSSLGLFRLIFGLMMIHDLMNERHMPHLTRVWSEPVHCHFPLFDFISPLPLAWMYVLYLVMLIGAICIAGGIVFGFTIWFYVIPYWYVFLLDKTRWNNHSYLYGLVSTLLAFTHAGNKYGVDALLFPDRSNTHVPFWNYAILRFQIFLVYFYAGLKKIDLDWLSGWSMQNLSKHWVFTPFSYVMSREMVDLVIVHFGGFFLDMVGGWLLLFPRTRFVAIVFLSKFHIMNATMFEIGMFPYVMLVTSAIFCDPDWPVRVFSVISKRLTNFRSNDSLKQPETGVNECRFSSACLYTDQEIQTHDDDDDLDPEDHVVLRAKPERGHKLTIFLLMCYVALQCFLPWSHFITKGYNLWTEGLYGYSWDMMVQTWSTQHIRVRFSSRSTNESGFLNPDAMTVGMGRRWSAHPDMIKQYGRCVETKLESLGVSNVSLHMDVWRSMNGRFQQRMVDPRVDILQAQWSPFVAPDWTMPLLSSLTDWRKKLMDIRLEFRRASVEAEERAPWVVFVADFPGLALENFVQPDVDRAYLELLDGEIEIEFLGSNRTETDPDPNSGNPTNISDCQNPDAHSCANNATAQPSENVTLTETGKRIKLPPGQFHRVHTLGNDVRLRVRRSTTTLLKCVPPFCPNVAPALTLGETSCVEERSGFVHLQFSLESRAYEGTGSTI